VFLTVIVVVHPFMLTIGNFTMGGGSVGVAIGQPFTILL